MKKLFISIISTLLPLMTNAAIEINGIWYNLNDNDHTAEVVASQGTPYSGDISILSYVYYNKSYTVTSIGNNAFEGCDDITSISLPNTLTRIGNGAFWQCSSLESVIIPKGVTTIGEGAFHNCFNLVSVLIPSSVTFIGSSAFSNCNNLTQVFSLIQNPFSINNNVFTSYSTTSLFTPKATKTAYQAKSGWKNFTNIKDEQKRTIHVATAGTLNNYISDCEKYYLEELTLSGNLNGTDIFLIRKMAGIYHYTTRSRFDGATYYYTDGILKSLDISNASILEGGDAYMATDDRFDFPGVNMTDIDVAYYYTRDDIISALMFYGTKLESIILPNTAISIGRAAFRDCSHLKSIKIPRSVTTIDVSSSWDTPYRNSLFCGCTSLSSIEVSEDNNVFDSRNGCNAIIRTKDNTLISGYKNTQIPNSVTSIGDYAFSGYNDLTHITIPNSVMSIGNYAFQNCSGLTTITMPNSVTSIGEWTFYHCSGLTSITIPNSVTSIGNYAFYNCSGLETIHSNIEWPFKIDASVFSEETYFNAKLIVPKDKKWFYQQTEGWNKFKNIVEEELAVKEFEANGVRYLIGENNTVSVTSKPEKYTGAVSIPSQVYYDGIKYSVTSIGQSAFEGCIDMMSVTIPNSVTTIGDAAFYYCTGLKTFDIPNGVTTIGEGAFSKCGGLASLSIPGSVTSIGKNAFFQCYGLTKIITMIENPFAIDDGVFPTSVYNSASLFVPSGKKTVYQNIAGWKRFANIAEIDKKRTIHVETAGTLPNLISEYEKYYIEELTLSGELNGTDIGFIRAMSGIKTEQEPNCLTFCDYYDVSTPGVLKVLDITNTNIVAGGGAYYAYTYNHTDDIHFYYFTETNTITEYMFYKCKLEIVKLPKTVTKIASGSCLPSVHISDLEAWCKIDFEEQPLERSHHLYLNDVEITDLVIPNSVTSISNRAFSGCSGLTSVTIPNSVTSIGNNAFNGCSGLSSVVSEIENPFIIDESVFNCSNKDIYATATLIVPIGKKSAYQSTAGWNKFQNIVEAGGGDKVFEADGVRYLIGENNTVSVTSKPEKYTGAISIPSQVYYDGINYTVTSIGQSAFEGCVDMTSVSIPSSVVTIDGAAFYYCTGLTTIDIPNGVKTIGEGAFSKCGGLTSVVIPGSVTSIGKNAFFQCYGLTQITSMIENPFAIDDGVFPTSVYNDASLFVPFGTKPAYQNTAGWKRFQNIVSVGGVYKLTYYVDGEEYKSVNYDYGAEITPEPAPTKEGYTFSGWSYIPSTMPAEEVNVFGSFTVNQYTITYIIDGEKYASETVDYNSKIVPPTPPSKDGFDFAWEEYPETMPAHDITINGTYTTTGILSIAVESGKAKIFTLDGRQVDTLQKGINIIKMEDGTIKKVVLSK